MRDIGIYGYGADQKAKLYPYRTVFDHYQDEKCLFKILNRHKLNNKYYWTNSITNEFSEWVKENNIEIKCLDQYHIMQTTFCFKKYQDLTLFLLTWK